MHANHRASVDEAVTKSISDTTAATNPTGHALRFPLYTALRPLVVLANPGVEECVQLSGCWDRGLCPLH